MGRLSLCGRGGRWRKGPEKKALKAFRHAYVELESRIKMLAGLRLESLDRLALQGRLGSTGRSRAPADAET